MVSCMDEGIGNVTKALEAAGMLDNTLIIFLADNGGPIQFPGAEDFAGVHGLVCSCAEGFYQSLHRACVSPREWIAVPVCSQNHTPPCTCGRKLTPALE
jgi:arylsulfatase A-like enzyme